MFTSLNWLNDFVEIDDIQTKEFEEKMTMSGTKVEGIEELGKEVTNVVVGKILSIEKHPDADKLVVTKVDVGEEVIQIVTGANNIRQGDYIPVAKIGAKLKDLKIKKSKLRGIESCGMMCSAGELGMNTSLLHKEDTEGIYILKEEYALGSDVKPILGLDDKIVEFELTANRSDCLSLMGIAREGSATFDRHLVFPIVEVNEIQEKIEDYLKIAIEDEELCPRYAARMVKVNKIEPSPDWMQRRLLNSGIRPISNIVDVTNYVMLEMGQPLHAFDYNKLNTGEILVRRAHKSEKLTTLDDIDRELTEDMIVITNGKEPVAIAGVMGGANSDIDDNTTMVVIEAAAFNKKSVRLTGRKLGLRSEAANRFEKGVDPNLAAMAADRAAQLLEEMGAGTVLQGMVDVYPKKVEPVTIEVDADWINKLIGIEISVDEMKEYLERLFLNVEVNGNKLLVETPTYRQDLEIKEDIAEEIARLYGYNNIPNTIMKGVTTKGGRNKKQVLELDIRNTLRFKGFYEILTTSFTGMSRLTALNITQEDPLFNSVKIINPLGEENSIMRPTLLPAMLQVLSHNYHRNASEAMLFEIATVYSNVEDLGKTLPLEEKKLCLGMYGDKDFFTLKGYVQLLLEKLRISEELEYNRLSHPSFHPGRAARLLIGNEEVGVLGELHPIVVENYDLPQRVYVCELNIDKLFALSKEEITFTELPKYPEMTRDMALLVKEQVTAKEIEDIIKANGKNLLQDVKIFDIYRGEQIPEGHKSMAYSLVFRAKDRTLTDGEVNEIFTKIIEEIEVKLEAKLRDA